MTTSMSNSSASSLLRLLVGPLLPTCGPPTLFLSNKVFCAIFQKSVLRTSFDSGSTATEKFTSISRKFSSLSLSKNSKAKISSIVLGTQKPQNSSERHQKVLFAKSAALLIFMAYKMHSTHAHAEFDFS